MIVTLTRMALTALLAVILWLALVALSGPLGFNSILADWLVTQAWVKALPPDAHDWLGRNTLQACIAAFVAFNWLWLWLKEPSTWLSARLFPPAPAFLTIPQRYPAGAGDLLDFRTRATALVGCTAQIAALDGLG